jgi:hypothetical protein
MTLDEILQDIHAMEQDLLAFERKYSMSTKTFYQARAIAFGKIGTYLWP